MLDRIEDAIAKLRAKRVAEGDIASALGKIIHSPAVALLVSITPNKVDDAVLEILKGLVPAE